ncbi:MAG TPA: proline--tRNA ligase [Candidatus Krumholzibacteria bacterium]|nr:proline--tRNA ligase [Candidatus Krumholzibacteria bacterium]
MRWSKYYLPTYKETPRDAEIPSHQLMLRAGLIKGLTSGVYSFLPAGLRVLHNVARIVREEMDRSGAQEVQMPVLHPGELYEETGRLKNFGELLFKLNDRRNRFFALGPTHEEVVTDIARDGLKSYKQLPQNIYQIQIKFRDEFRPRFGVMRAREFMMKDAYSFHATPESLQETYEVMAGTYASILKRCGLDAVRVAAESGAIGGDVNHEFIVLADAGESVLFRCPECGYAANDERAETTGPKTIEKEPAGMQTVATPGKHTVDEVAGFLKVSPQRLVKTLLFRAGDRVIAALVPGDRELNEIRFAKVIGTPDFRPLDEAEILEVTGGPVGFSGPVGLEKRAEIIADALLDGYQGMIVGANQKDMHLRGVVMGKDFKAARTAPLSTAKAGDICKNCGKGELELQRGVEIGHIFKLDTKYSAAMRATFLDAEGKDHPFIMGCYGFGVSRAVAAAIEQHHDAKGIRWPKALTPFHVILTLVNISDEATTQAAERLYAEMGKQGLDVLMDDRDLRPGAKFKDAELVGVPLRVTLGERNLKDGNAEVYYRLEDRTEIVPLDRVTGLAGEFYAGTR